MYFEFHVTNYSEERKCVEEELISSKMEAERAATAKSTFLATMSHEIRLLFI